MRSSILLMTFQISIFFSLIRALFPKWSFFDQTGFSFEVHYRLESPTDWKKLSFDNFHKGLNFLSNPYGNEVLLQMNIVEQFVRDIQEAGVEQIHASSSSIHRLFLSLLRQKIFATNSPQPIQVKILAKKDTLEYGTSEEVIVYSSDWIAMEQE